MKHEGVAETITGAEEEVSYASEGLAVWIKYSQDGINGNQAWFDFREGNISVKNPDAEIRNKMIDIAIALKAKVQGDDDEIYDTRETPKAKRPWWQIWS